MIEQQDLHLYNQSEQLYKNTLPFETVEQIFGRQLRIDQTSENIMRTRIKQRGDWRVPGMIIRPGLESHVDDMVALDPLYLVDSNIELLEPAKQRYLPEYQRRLRLYTVNDYAEKPIFKKFPVNQFGLIFAYNYFNFKPLSVISNYLEELFQLLRPGGILTFTYNNCDQWHCVAFAEKEQMCYTPGNKLKKIAQEHGYVVNFEYDGLSDAKWIELQKPGELTSIRGGQSLAKIVAGQ
jgi:SAM-dependent methyltransferase